MLEHYWDSEQKLFRELISFSYKITTLIILCGLTILPAGYKQSFDQVRKVQGLILALAQRGIAGLKYSRYFVLKYHYLFIG